DRMKHAWLVVRSAILWTICSTYFVFAVLSVLLIGARVGQRRIDPVVRLFSRGIVFLGGARLEVRRAPGFGSDRTCFFVANHVNMFDPFVLYSSIPQFVRGLELESHFSVPVYGWLMKRFGNVPVPDVRTPSGLKRTYRLAREALENGTSLVVFAEASRTLDGRVGDFESEGSRLLRPATVVVHIHDTIETQGLGRKDLQALRDRVHEIVSKPVSASAV
ncbi:MAG: lysophospholipid acyltransferase family protein, partial [Planctomycetota bacterium]